jgi:hypothetical protein
VGTFLLAAVTDKLGPYAAVMGAGFLIGVYGHVIKSRTLIITGIVMVGVVSAYFTFFVAKIT